VSVTASTEDAATLARASVDTLFKADRVAQAFAIEILAVAPRQVSLTMTVRPDMVNGHGMCHGGVVFALADCAFAFACNSLGAAMVAASANIEFMKPTAVGTRLIATAGEIARDERYGMYDVAVTDDASRLVAHFRGRCACLRSPSPVT
jgi:acyl-CoA thioesterase